MSVLRPLAPYPGWEFSSGQTDPANAFLRTCWEGHRAKHGFRYPIDFHYGITLELNLGDDLSQSLYVNGCYEPNEFYFLDRFLGPGMTVVDAGAHEGLYSLFMAHKVGPSGMVWSFEPSRREYDRLLRNIELNDQLPRSSMRPMPVALGADAGFVPLLVAGPLHSGQNTLAHKFGYDIGAGTCEWVAEVPLDALRGSFPDRLDLIKLDVEGYECDVLWGALKLIRDFYPAILFEANEQVLQANGTSREELLELITGDDWNDLFRYTLFQFSPETGLLEPGTAGLNLVALSRANRKHAPYFS